MNIDRNSLILNTLILNTVRRALRIFPASDSVLVVGVSGGVDSLVLLHALARLREELTLHVHVATLDHRLRGQAGADDAAFVEATARAWGLDVTREAADVPLLARERGLSIEHAARVARYDFLAATARRAGAKVIVTAHHADDHVETVLLHLVRGAGLAGLAGLRSSAPVPGHADLTLLRPLLDVHKIDLEAYAQAHDLKPRVDATNADTRYARNRMRLEVLPALRAINPDADAAIGRLTEAAAVDEAYLSALTADVLTAHARTEGDRVVFARAALADLNVALQRRVVRAIAMCFQADGPSHERILAAVTLGLTGAVGAVVQLGGGVRLRIDYDLLVFEAEGTAFTGDQPTIDPHIEIEVQPPMRVALGGWTLVVGERGVDFALPHAARLIVRARRVGDRFAPPGMDDILVCSVVG